MAFPTITRVREVIPFLIWDELKGFLPLDRLRPFWQIPGRGGRFCGLEKKIGPSNYGILFDTLIKEWLRRKFFEDESPLDYTTLEIPWWDRETIKIDQYVEFFRESRKIVEEIPLWTSPQFDTEISVGELAGHPDVWIGSIIYDIKTTGFFSRMREETLLQILSYYTLAQASGEDVESIGLILPAQNQVIAVNLADWDWIPFWEALQKAMAEKRSLASGLAKLAYSSQIQRFVGAHIGKKKTLHHTLQEWAQQTGASLPCQLFLAGRAHTNIHLSPTEEKKTHELVTQLGLRVYVHAPYNLNLSRHYEDNWVVVQLRRQLTTARTLGFRGVVVHCGKRAEQTEDEAQTHMFSAVIEASSEASTDCPLLIETSAGQRGELYSNPEELMGFYRSLPSEVQEKVGICLDTCHVFSAGYGPLETVQSFLEAEIPFPLIHYNDSAVRKGAGKDRHRTIGCGFVGLDELTQIGFLALNQGIDLVNE